MTFNAAEILQNAATYWIAPFVADAIEPLPDPNTISGGDDWGGNWESMGYTSGPTTITWNVTRADVTPQQLIAPITGWNTGFMPEITTSLMQLDPETLERVFAPNQAVVTPADIGQVGIKQLDIVPSVCITFFTLGLEILDCRTAFFHRFYMPKVTITPSGPLVSDNKSSEAIVQPVTFKSYETGIGGAAMVSWQRKIAEATG